MPRRSLQFRSTLSLEGGAGPFRRQRWMDLLASIADSGSIAQAARRVGLTYKAAWDAIDAMNNVAPRPLVLRSKGGRGGGGTALTDDGRRLVAAFAAVSTEHRRFVKDLEDRFGVRPAELQTMRRLTMLTSARNHFAGKVTRIARGAVNDEIELTLPGGERIVAVITHESTRKLGLKKGSEAVALIKASWVMVGTADGPALKLSARNQLTGAITRITRGAVNSEVVIGLKGGASVVAIITNDAVRSLKLRAGKQAFALFKASSVILGVSP
jgi:molybdate transport system regulatory protein